MALANNMDPDTVLPEDLELLGRNDDGDLLALKEEKTAAAVLDAEQHGKRIEREAQLRDAERKLKRMRQWRRA